HLCLRSLPTRRSSDLLGRRLDGRTHDDIAAGMAGNGALDQQQAAFGVDTHDVEVLNGTGHIAQVASHALAGEDAARILRLADRADRKSTRLNSSHVKS